MQKFSRIPLAAYITNQEDADHWQRVIDHYGDPDKSASALIVQLIREKSLDISGGATKRQQLKQANSGIDRISGGVDLLLADNKQLIAMVGSLLALTRAQSQTIIELSDKFRGEQ